MVTREGFQTVNANGFMSLGLRGGASQAVFPSTMFLPGADLTTLQENIDRIIDGLTQWEPATRETARLKTPKLTVTGNGLDDAVIRMNKLFLKNLWSDGLPILPATEERVNWLLSGTAFPRDRAIARILPRGGIATVESVAVFLAMAGGRPEYMPVLIASIEAITHPGFKHERMQATTNSGHPAVIVSGPIAKQIRLSSGYGCLGPDPRYPAGGVIGRAIRLLLLVMGGSIPGTGSMSLYGGPARYTGLVFAEDEDGLPPGWPSLSVDRGFSRGDNIVTAHSVSSTVNIVNGYAETAEKLALSNLDACAEYLGVTTGVYVSGAFSPDGTPGILLLTRATALMMAEAGWSKEKIRTYLWEKTKRPDSPLLRDLLDKNIEKAYLRREHAQIPMPIAHGAKNIMVVIAGGDNASHSYWLQTSNTYRSISAEIRLPNSARWDKLLAQAEEEMGSPPG